VKRDVLPILRGTVGETAWSGFLNDHFARQVCTVDTSLRAFGDSGCDLAVGTRSLQVKTRMRAPNLVRRVKENKRLARLSSDLFLFAEWGGGKTCLLLGWQWREQIQTIATLERSPVGQHWNLVILDEDLEPPVGLLSELEGAF